MRIGFRERTRSRRDLKSDSQVRRASSSFWRKGRERVREGKGVLESGEGRRDWRESARREWRRSRRWSSSSLEGSREAT